MVRESVSQSSVGFSSISDALTDTQMKNDIDGSIDVSSGPPSFDDFERVENVRKEVKKAKEEKGTDGKKVTDGKKEEKKDDQNKGKNETEIKKDKVPDEGRKTQEDGESDKENIEETEDKIEEVKSKGFKIKSGDKEFDLTGDELIDVKVNGEIQQVKLSELKNNFSGKVGWDKKFTELDKKHKADIAKVKEEKEELYKPLQKFEKLVAEGKAGDAILHLVDFVGQDSYTFRKSLLAAMEPIIKARLEMSPEQLEASDYRLEVEHLRQKEKSALERSKREQAQRELSQRAAKLQETYSISDDDFKNHAQKLKELLIRDGKFSQESYNPESVADFYLATKASNKFFNVIDKIDPSLGSDEKLVQEAIRLLIEVPSMTDEELKEIIYEYKGVNSKLKQATKKAGVQEKFTPPPATHEKVNFFEDFE